MSILDPRASLLPHLSPYQVDFVIPRIGIDLPLGIDPFLLFKSRDSEYRRLHTLLIATFNAGVASYLAGLIIDTLDASPALQQRGVRHVEEMQLLSAGIGPDRVSDITANVLKRFLIEYTQRQCHIWNVEMA